jgi:hypothetical protein
MLSPCNRKKIRYLKTDDYDKQADFRPGNVVPLLGLNHVTAKSTQIAILVTSLSGEDLLMVGVRALEFESAFVGYL